MEEVKRKDELKVAAYIVSKAAIDYNTKGRTADYTVQGATLEECLSKTGLTEERARAAIERLNEQGAGITIG